MPTPVSPEPLHCVLDTNVVLDLFHFADPVALPILQALENGKLACWADEATLAELARVLTYPELNVAAQQAAQIMQRYQELCRRADAGTVPLAKLPRCPDPDDQKFLELAARTGARLLISKDKALLGLARKPGLPFQIMPPNKAATKITGMATSKQ
ncbi:MAG: hypothetical protein BWY57_00662 [Betaproteobacteria bacterium ADurb.Bin341]|nr:MAG: hypothetical protein BWY57_00662 [Betaproteobacteria bacterium ADurb.Bin341]